MDKNDNTFAISPNRYFLQKYASFSVRDEALRIPTPGPIYHVSYHVPYNTIAQKTKPKRDIHYMQHEKYPESNEEDIVQISNCPSKIVLTYYF